MILTATPSKFKATDLTRCDVTDAEATAHFTTEFEIGQKDGEAIIPAILKDCPAVCRNVGSGRKDCGGSHPHRLGPNVEAMTALGVDLDHLGGPEAMAALLERLSAPEPGYPHGLRFWWWETYSHVPPTPDAPAGAPRARLLIPFVAPYPIRSPAHWSRGAWPALIKHLNLGVAAAADEACKDPARVYYLPRKPCAEAVRNAGYHDGAPLDWAPIFGRTLDAFQAAAEVVVAPPVEDPAHAVDLEAVRVDLRRIKQPSLAPLVGRLLDGVGLVSPPSQRKPGEPSRYRAWLSVTSALSMVTEAWMSTEALYELLRPTWYAEQTESPEDFTAWEIITGLLATARASAPRRKAEKEAARAATASTWSKVLGIKFSDAGKYRPAYLSRKGEK